MPSTHDCRRVALTNICSRTYSRLVVELNSPAARCRSVPGRNGVQLHVVEAGDDSHPTVVLVHGFPDDHSVWSEVIDELAGRFHVVAFDTRGSGASGAPHGRRAYTLDVMVADLRSVIDATASGKRVHLVGHDWGSVQAWHAATGDDADAYITSLTSISGGSLDHIAIWMRRRTLAGITGLREVLTMWKSPFYMGPLQTPWIGPLLCRRGVVDVSLRWARRFEIGTPLTDQRHRGRANVAGVQIYAANLVTRLLRPQKRHCTIPTQILVPRNDIFVTPATAAAAQPFTDNLTVHTLDGGHWIPAFRPDAISEHIARFCTEHAATPTLAKDIARE